jgi:hypothetical protein
MWSTRNSRASISWIWPPPKLLPKLQRLPPRASPRVPLRRLLPRRRGPRRRRWPPRRRPYRRLPLPRQGLPPLCLQPEARPLRLAFSAPALFRRRVLLALRRVRLVLRPSQLRLQRDLAQFHRPQVHGPAFPCVRKPPARRWPVRPTRLPDNPALPPHSGLQSPLRPRLQEQLPPPVLRGLRALRRAVKDFRRRVRLSPDRDTKGNVPARLKACVLPRLPAVPRGQAALRGPVVDLPEDFRNDLAGAAAARGKLPLAASVPVRRAACRRLNRVSRSMRASLLPRADVR